MAAFSSSGRSRTATNYRHGSRDSLSAAAEAAAKVNAMLIAKGKLKPVQLHKGSKNKGHSSSLFDAEVEINDAPIVCRDMLTRNAKQDEISKKSGAFISTKGRYFTTEQRRSSSQTDRPLYLYIQAATENSVQRAVKEINDIISRNGGVVNQTRGASQSIPVMDSTGLSSQLPNVRLPPPSLQQHPPAVLPTNTTTLPSTIQFISEKLYVGLEHAPPSFDVRGRMLGSGGSYLQHIHSSSGAVVTLRGRGSGYLDPKTTQESTEPMHIHLQHATVDGLRQAIQLGKDLIGKVQHDYSLFQQELARQPPASAVSFPTAVHNAGSFVMPRFSSAPQQLGYQQSPHSQAVVYQSRPSPMSGLPATPQPMNGLPPVSRVMSQGQNSNYIYSQSHPVTFVQAPHVGMPVTVSNARIGYNSLTSHAVEVVEKGLSQQVVYNGGGPYSQPPVPYSMTASTTIYPGLGSSTANGQQTQAFTLPPPSLASNPIMHHQSCESQTVVLEVIQPVPPPDAPVEGYVVERVQSEVGQPPPLIQPGQILPVFDRPPPVAQMAQEQALHMQQGPQIVHMDVAYTQSGEPVRLVASQYENQQHMMPSSRADLSAIPKLMDIEIPPPGIITSQSVSHQPPVQQVMTSRQESSVIHPSTIYEYRCAGEGQVYGPVQPPSHNNNIQTSTYPAELQPRKRTHEEPCNATFYAVAPPPPPPAASHADNTADTKRFKDDQWYPNRPRSPSYWQQGPPPT